MEDTGRTEVAVVVAAAAAAAAAAVAAGKVVDTHDVAAMEFDELVVVVEQLGSCSPISSLMAVVDVGPAATATVHEVSRC